MMSILHIMLKLNLPVHALHVNYKLRGEESNKDQEFIQKICAVNKIPMNTLNINGEKELKHKGNLQSKARAIRYNFFKTFLTSTPDSYIVTGHTQNDQIETFWLQLIRNAGRSGLGGMKAENNRILRPLLSISKNEIIEYARKNNIAWREDASNSKNIYVRNTFRNQIIPDLESKFEGLSRSILLIQELIRATEDSDLRDILEYINASNRHFKIDELTTWSHSKLLLFIKHFGLDGSQLMAFISYLKSSSGSKFETDKISFLINRQELLVLKECTTKAIFPKLITASCDSLPEQFDKKSMFIDNEKIAGEIYVRHWIKGDRISPIGMRGTKLISDLFSDEKIPLHQKRTWPIVCDQEHILFAPSLCIDRRKIATSKSKEILKISLVNE